MIPTRDPADLTPVERSVSLAGITTRWLQTAGEGPPLLLVHGYADSADSWRPLLRELARSGRAAAAIDLGGFGAAGPLRRDRPLLPQWDSMVAAAVGELAASSGGDVQLAGNSLGGCLALRAAQDPELPIGGIVPIAPAGLHMARWFPIIEGERLIRLLRFSPLPVPGFAVREVVGRVYASLVFSDPRSVDPAAVASFTRHIPSVQRGMEILETGRRLLPELEDPFELERISCPLLLVWGDSDRMVFTAGAERVLRTVPYSEIEVIERCGHCPQVEAPDRLARILLSFPDAYERGGALAESGP